MNDKETINNLQSRLNILSNVMVDMFMVVSRHLPATNEQLKSIVHQWEKVEGIYPLPNDEYKENEREQRLVVAAINKLSKAKDQITKLQKENNQLRANHADMVSRNAALRDRPDIPTERVKSVQALEDQITKLQDFVIWMTGCGYDFRQLDYFIKQRDELLKTVKK